MQTTAVLPVVAATRYLTPLREGGSLPGIMEADDLGTYVCKFRGAGQGLRVLVAEVIAGELARGLGFATPALVGLDVDAAIARYEADEEVQDLLTASLGLNLGVDFLPSSFGFDSTTPVSEELAAKLLWFDAFIANVDRTWRNPNLLVWHGEVWLIEQGAALYFHHACAGVLTDPQRFAVQPWDAADHVCSTADARAVDSEMAALATDDLLRSVVELVPDEWLSPVPGAERASDQRDAYVRFLAARRDGGRPWLPRGAA
ncbi:MAG: HipA family kinase [Marmoricola sp.]